MKINKMITKRKILSDLLTNSLKQFFKDMASLKNLYVNQNLGA